MIIDFEKSRETKQAQQDAVAFALQAAEQAQKAEFLSQVNLEWVLADLLADIQAA